MEWQQLQSLLAGKTKIPLEDLYASFCRRQPHRDLDRFVAHLWSEGAISATDFLAIQEDERIAVHAEDGTSEDPYRADQMLVAFTKLLVEAPSLKTPASSFPAASSPKSEEESFFGQKEPTWLQAQGGWLHESTESLDTAPPFDEMTIPLDMTEEAPSYPHDHADADDATWDLRPPLSPQALAQSLSSPQRPLRSPHATTQPTPIPPSPHATPQRRPPAPSPHATTQATPPPPSSTPTTPKHTASPSPHHARLTPPPQHTTHRAASASQPAPSSSDPLEQYEILGIIGQGGVGTVHLARDKSLRRKVAIKRLHQHAGRSEMIKHRFLREAQVTAQLDHPHIVPLYTLNTTPDGVPAYAMKLVQGKTLYQIIKECIQHDKAKQPLPPELNLTTRLEHFLKICDAIAYAHSKGVIHRDLKPANIMVGRYNQVYVMDWGLARILREEEHLSQSIISQPPSHDEGIHETLSGQILGTPPYMSPEQATGLHPILDGRSDLYALGLILFELVALRPAIDGHTGGEIIAKAMRGYKAPLIHRSHQPIHKALQAIIHKATAPERENRYPRVEDFAQDLRAYLRGDAILAKPDNPLQSLARKLFRHRSLSLILLLTLALLTMGFALQSQHQQEKTLQQARKRETLISQLLTHAALQGNLIENSLLRYEAALGQLAASSRELLLHGSLSKSYEPLLLSNLLQDPQALSSPQSLPHYPTLVSFRQPLWLLPPTLPFHKTQPPLARLAPLDPILRETLSLSPHHPALPLPAEQQQPTPARTRTPRTPSPLRWISLATPQGARMLYPAATLFTRYDDPRQRPWYRIALQKTGFSWHLPPPDAQGEDHLLSCSHTIHDAQGQPLAILAFEIHLHALAASLKLFQAHPTQQHFLLDPQGRIALASPQAPRTLEQTNLQDAIQKQHSGLLEETHKNQRFLYAFQRLDAMGWYFVIRAPSSP